MAKSGSIKIEVPAEFERWVSGLKSLEIGPQEAVLFDQATDVLFAATQARVHVLSGDLKRSGERIDHVLSGSKVTTEIKYGGVVGSQGRLIDYGPYEIARGGSHDFVGPAIDQTRAVFEEAMVDMATAMLERKVG